VNEHVEYISFMSHVGCVSGVASRFKH